MLQSAQEGALVQRVQDAPNQPPLYDHRRDFGPGVQFATPARSMLPHFEDEGALLPGKEVATDLRQARVQAARRSSTTGRYLRPSRYPTTRVSRPSSQHCWRLRRPRSRMTSSR